MKSREEVIRYCYWEVAYGKEKKVRTEENISDIAPQEAVDCIWRTFDYD